MSTHESPFKRIVEQATGEATSAGITLAVVHLRDPEDDGEYGYCPVGRVQGLFPGGQIVGMVGPDGEYVDGGPRPAGPVMRLDEFLTTSMEARQALLEANGTMDDFGCQVSNWANAFKAAGAYISHEHMVTVYRQGRGGA